MGVPLRVHDMAGVNIEGKRCQISVFSHLFSIRTLFKFTCLSHIQPPIPDDYWPFLQLIDVEFLTLIS